MELAGLERCRWNRIAEAHALVDTGRKRGAVVIAVR
jgi:hypothetical protein